MKLLGDIALFVEVVNAKGFTAAAHRLDMPTSTISRRIAALERHIGLRLFNRTTRRVEVTEAGNAYYRRCAHLIAEAQLAHEEISESVNLPRGTLRISCTPDFANIYLPQVLTAYVQRYPQVSVELDLSTRIVDLVLEGVDAALRFGRLPDSSLVARKLGSIQLGLYATPAYLAHAPVLTQPEQLARHACIRMGANDRGSHWALFAQAPEGPQATPVVVKVQGQFCVRSVAMIHQLALAGAGIGIIDSVLAQPDVASGKLTRVLPEWHLAPVELNLLTTSRLVPARVRLFGDMLAEKIPAMRRI